MQASAVLRLDQLQAALDRCMRVHPPTGLERRLHPDASSMANLWAQLTLQRVDSVSWFEVDQRVQAAFERWHIGEASLADRSGHAA